MRLIRTSVGHSNPRLDAAGRGNTRPFRLRRSAATGVAAAIAVALASTPAHAYIDPGTGGMLLQLLLGGVAGAMVIVKLYWQRIKEGFQSVFGGGEKVEQSVDRENENSD